MTTAQPPLSADELERYRLARTGGDRTRLEWSGFKVYSQSDEDGIIERIFEIIGTTDRRFVEFGCEAGLENNRPTASTSGPTSWDRASRAPSRRSACSIRSITR